MPISKNSIWPYIYRQRYFFGLGLMLLVCTNIAQMMIPQLFRQAIDAFQLKAPQHHLSSLTAIIWKIVFVAVFAMILRTLSRVYLLFAARDVELLLRADYYAHLTQLSQSFFRRQRLGDLMSRATQDLTQVRLMLGPGLLNSFNAIVAYATAIPLMWQLSPNLTIIGFSFYPPALLMMWLRARVLFRHSQHQNQCLGALSHLVQDTLRNIALIRETTAYTRSQQLFAAANNAYQNASIQQIYSRAGIFRASATLATISTLCCLYLGAQYVQQQKLSLGSLVALMEYLAVLSWPTFALGWVITLYQRGRAGLQRIMAILAEPAANATLKQTVLLPLRFPLIARDLTVAYEDDPQPVLHGIHFRLEQGQTLGVVGAIGSGKSTLLQAICGLIPVAEQQLLFNQTDIKQIALNDLWRFCSLVNQKPQLFSATLRENIAFGAPTSTPMAIAAAADTAQMNADIALLPQGLDTLIGEMGVNLSGGQKMRTTVARAMLVDAPLLLLDDVMAALDTEVASRLQQALMTVRAGKTTIIVSHRLHTVMAADEILVLQQGIIAQRGCHQDLIAQPGWYQRVFHEQYQEEDRARR